MPKNRVQTAIFTIMMVLVMVYGMICYNITLEVGGLSNFVFLAACRAYFYGTDRIPSRYACCLPHCVASRGQGGWASPPDPLCDGRCHLCAERPADVPAHEPCRNAHHQAPRQRQHPCNVDSRLPSSTFPWRSSGSSLLPVPLSAGSLVPCSARSARPQTALQSRSRNSLHLQTLQRRFIVEKPPKPHRTTMAPSVNAGGAILMGYCSFSIWVGSLRCGAHGARHR